MQSPTSFSKIPSTSPRSSLVLLKENLDPSQQSDFLTFYIKLTKRTLISGLPTIFCLELNIISVLINLYLIGHLNSALLLGALGVALVWLNCMAYTIFISLNTGLVSLSAQAFGKKDYILTGLYYQRGAIINLVVFIVCSIILICSAPILRALGMEPVVVDYAMDYIYYSIPSIFFFSYYDLTKSFLQVQQIYNPQMIIQIVNGITHFIFAWIFIFAFDLGLKGAGLARSCSDFLNFLMIFCYIKMYDPTPKTWFAWSQEAFKGWKNYIRVSIVIGLTFYLESVCFEIMTIFAGNLPNPEQLAAHVAMANTATMFFFIPFGLSIVMQNLVGNAMGGGNTFNGKVIAKVGIILNFFIVFFFFLLMFFGKSILASLFTKEEIVVVILEDVIKLYGILCLADYTQIFLSGILKGIGKEDLTLGIYMVTYYLIGIPFSYVFAFTLKGGVYGIWMGWLIGVYITVGIFIWILCKIDWEKQCDEIKIRLANDQEAKYIELENK